MDVKVSKVEAGKKTRMGCIEAAVSFLCSVGEIALVGLLLMWAMQYLHHDVHGIPALGYTACWFTAAGSIVFLRVSRGRQ